MPNAEAITAPVLHVFRNDTELVIAANIEAAQEYWNNVVGDDPSEFGPWRAIADDVIIPIYQEDDPIDTPGVRKSAAEWAAEKGTVCILACEP